MMLKIGEKIKELREKKNITQNKMADYLGITEQAISRWENGGGYPDIELIPAISNFLDVSTDELFETDKKEERLKSLLREAGKNMAWDRNTICKNIEVYRSILKEFPNDFDTMSYLISYLAHDNYNPLGKRSEEIIDLCNRIINDCPDIAMRKSATHSSAQAYKDMGEQEKAVKLIKESSIITSLISGIHQSREYILSFIAESEEASLNLKNMLQILFDELCSCIWNNLICTEYQTYITNDNISNKEWLEIKKRHIIILEKVNKIIEIFYEDGDYAWLRETMLYHYQVLAENYMIFGEYDKAIDNIEKCAETAILFDTDELERHTSILVKNLYKSCNYNLTNYGSHAENIRYNQSYRLIHDWFLSEEFTTLTLVGETKEHIPNYEFYAPIRETDRFKAVIANLERYAKVEKIEE